MKYYSKAISLAMIISFMGTPLALAQTPQYQNYQVLPPAEQNESYTLPDLNMPYGSGNVLKGQVVTIPVGSSFQAMTNSTVSTATCQVGDIVTATISQPISFNGNIVIPEGSEAIGQVTYLEGAGRAGKNAALEIRFTSIKLPNGQKVPISGKIVTAKNSGTLKGGSLKNQIVTATGTTAISTAAGTLTGLTIGAIASHVGVFTVMGTIGGGVLGIGYLIGRKGQEVVLQSGTKLNISLEQPVSIGR